MTTWTDERARTTIREVCLNGSIEGVVVNDWRDAPFN